MINLKVYTYSTCEEILNFKTDSQIRNLYDQTDFKFDNAKFLREVVKLKIIENDISFKAKPGNDLENSIRIFSALKDLDLVQANDKRLWVTLTHTIFFNYAKERWGISKSTTNDVIRDRFHFEGSGLRARNQNSIARLWWAARITYDESRQDPFELTKLLWEKQDFYQNLIDRKFSTYKGTLDGFITFYADNKHLDLKNEMRKLFRGINAYGGVKVLSLLEEHDVRKQIYQLCKFYKIQANVA